MKSGLTPPGSPPSSSDGQTRRLPAPTTLARPRDSGKMLVLPGCGVSLTILRYGCYVSGIVHSSKPGSPFPGTRQA
ncbi:MAG: hypothetical protein O7F16_08450, partial [Acidobacteria bacterium]|nr:hypothetical protein [Acidobacteriota bacterium]